MYTVVSPMALQTQFLFTSHGLSAEWFLEAILTFALLASGGRFPVVHSLGSPQYKP